jgi:hypothetical protein
VLTVKRSSVPQKPERASLDVQAASGLAELIENRTERNKADGDCTS